ncbi:MAG: hypothetical protein IPK60_04860 [Sandaracinaceae bacterium]|nr:hypothetical protein [Sandaracinaceae bacterium]
MTDNWDFPTDPCLEFHDAGFQRLIVTNRDVIIELSDVSVYSSREDEHADLYGHAVTITFTDVTEVSVLGRVTTSEVTPFEDINVYAACAFMGEVGLDWPNTSEPVQITSAKFDLTQAKLVVKAASMRIDIGARSGRHELV